MVGPDRWAVESNQKICAFDLDGVLNYYPDPWVDFLNKALEPEEPFRDLNDAKGRIPYSLYKEIKWKYRECGIKAELEIRAGAKEVLDELKRREYQILILTSRPFSKHKVLFKQTSDWLDRGDLPYDGIIFGEEKYVEVLTRAPNLRFLVDDHRYYCQSVAKWGYETFLVDNIHNQGSLLPEVHRISELKELLSYDVTQ